ncbi:unnamed protein product [Lathyrus oleraceus]|uniref:Dof-type domain-containing protein n=1 Tax=Pisum sativum TaxID=3888 RepID=A0A9D4Y2Y2_PEA|nr:cyclic dof factor 1-like [Pisum sativum]KAI5432088.1 hypothetical protein KIW84_036009 [Pisum sativum]
MLETKDSAIKLFGKTIPVKEILVGLSPLSSADVVDHIIHHHNHDSSTNSSTESHNTIDAKEQEIHKDTVGEKPTDEKNEDGVPTQSNEESTNPDAASRTGEESVTASTEKEVATLKASKTEEEQDETSNSQEKSLKKPDKIIPCPRCSSMDTKFCYYNNYNVNQPRHFCKNCQRYWTAGGTMRNVPVGAGRRRNKSCSSHYRQITVSEATLQNSRIHPSLKCNGTVLTFGSDSPLSESMASVLKLAHNPEELRIHLPRASEEKGDDQSNKSSVTSVKSTDGASKNLSQEQARQYSQSFPPQGHYFPPGTPCPFPWNPMQWRSPVPPPAFSPTGFSLPFYPATTYWGCTVPGGWNVPWQAQPSSPNAARPNSSPNSPTLGKHSREDGRKESSEEKCLRIDDSGEPEKSSFWTTLRIKNDDTASPVPSGRLFHAFPSKPDKKNESESDQASSVLQANPAALSRSHNFHETS